LLPIKKQSGALFIIGKPVIYSSFWIDGLAKGEDQFIAVILVLQVDQGLTGAFFLFLQVEIHVTHSLFYLVQLK
jgi:hypothetical protein